jgi:hypothetical protein
MGVGALSPDDFVDKKSKLISTPGSPFVFRSQFQKSNPTTAITATPTTVINQPPEVGVAGWVDPGSAVRTAVPIAVPMLLIPDCAAGGLD